MSVNLMSAIFETEFFDLKDEHGNITKASTAKLILLAMADHANDEGEGAYPSIERLCRKTALSPQTIRNTFDALRYNGIILLTGLSKHGTNNHTINTNSFPKAIGKEVTVLTLYPLEGSNQSLLPLQPVTSDPLPVRPESLLTTKETSAIAEPVHSHKRGDAVDMVMDLQIKPAKIRKAFADFFKLTPNWEAKYNRQFLEWSVVSNVTPEQVQHAADIWRRDKRFNWQVPTLRSIQEHWLELIEHVVASVVQPITEQPDQEWRKAINV